MKGLNMSGLLKTIILLSCVLANYYVENTGYRNNG